MIWSRLCSRCNSASWRRSKRRNAFERVISPLVLPVRCERCDSRFYRLRAILSRMIPPANHDHVS
jgi:hypothetical protein